jgi:hypothetical protein
VSGPRERVQVLQRAAGGKFRLDMARGILFVRAHRKTMRNRLPSICDQGTKVLRSIGLIDLSARVRFGSAQLRHQGGDGGS